jgi:hypothetical protein
VETFRLQKWLYDTFSSRTEIRKEEKHTVNFIWENWFLYYFQVNVSGKVKWDNCSQWHTVEGQEIKTLKWLPFWDAWQLQIQVTKLVILILIPCHRMQTIGSVDRCLLRSDIMQFGRQVPFQRTTTTIYSLLLYRLTQHCECRPFN